MEKIHRFKQNMFRSAKIAAYDLRASDKASGNLRLCHHEFNQPDLPAGIGPPCGVLKDIFICRNHANHLVTGSVIGSVFGIQMLNGMMTVSNFVRMGTHFLRVLLSIRQYVTENVLPVLGEHSGRARV